MIAAVDTPSLFAADDERCDYDPGLYRDGWALPDRLRASEWAEMHVKLPDKSPLPGMFRLANAPYLRGLLDMATTPGVVELNVQKAGQIGVSLALRILLGFWAVTDPRPAALALPDKNKGQKIVRRHVAPFFRSTPPLAILRTGWKSDETLETVSLANGFHLDLIWAGSASSTASETIAHVVTDETDKMKAWGQSGGEGHPVYRLRTRMRVFLPDAMMMNVSTPTYEHGMITQLVDDSTVRLRFLVPCPHCAARIALMWPNVQYEPRNDGEDRSEHAARVLADRLAWYECQACGETITERERRVAIGHGWYGTADSELMIGDGEIENAEAVPLWPARTRIGIEELSALYCLWPSCSMQSLAAQWIEAQSNNEKLFAFCTETLGQPYRQSGVRTVKADEMSARCAEAETDEGVCPYWTARLIATIDTQKDHFYTVIRAWGPGMRSRRVWHGIVKAFDDLDELLARSWPVERSAQGPRRVELALIDSGGTTNKDTEISRTQEVYAYTMDRAHVLPIKGASSSLANYYRIGRGNYGTGQRKRRLDVWYLDVHRLQNQLAQYMDDFAYRVDAKTGEETKERLWQLNTRNDEEYNAHVTNFHRAPKLVRGSMTETWEAVRPGGRVDYRHCEGYQVAAAFMRGIHALPPLDEFMAQLAVRAAPKRPKAEQAGIRSPVSLAGGIGRD